MKIPHLFGSQYSCVGGSARAALVVRPSLAIMLLTLGACSCGDDSTARSLIITAPTDGMEFMAGDDVDPMSDGLQIDISVEGMNLSEGTEVELSEASGAVSPSTQMLDADGAASFRVTLDPGSYMFTATVTDPALTASVSLSVIGGCARIDFVTPAAPASGPLTLGPSDDVDGDACGVEFATDVRVATDAGAGATGTLMVNGTTVGSAQPVVGTVLSFDGVVLGNRGSTPNSLGVLIETATGERCTEMFGTDILVDCDGVSCAITQPSTDDEFLSSEDDASAEDGFQGDFEITSDAEAVGQSLNLVVDGDTMTATAVAAGGDATAAFNGVALSEGLHTVRAECFDEAGNMTRSPTATWTVDTQPCGIAIDMPTASQLFVDDDDVNPAMGGLQIDVTGSITGSDCAGVQLAVGEGVGEAASLAAGAFMAQVTLGGDPMQTITAAVTDQAGNTAEATVDVRTRLEGPRLQFSSPSEMTTYNIAGDGGAVADLNPTTRACEANIVVDCSDLGATVTLRRTDTLTPLGTATCEMTTAMLMDPFVGQAVFDAVPLDTRNDGTGYNIVATALVDRVMGMSSALGVNPDCDAPVLEFFDPRTCPAVFRPSVDDSDPVADGFQYNVTIANTNSPQPDVELRVLDSMMAEVYSQTEAPSPGLTFFTDVQFGGADDYTMEACATDIAGNRSCATCMATVAELPTLNIVEPSADDVLTLADDCGAAPGLQIRVRAQTNATSGTVLIGGGTTNNVGVSGGFIDECVDVESQEGSLNLTVRAMDANGDAAATIPIVVDTLPPVDAVSTLGASIQDRRGGVIRFSWTAVADNGGLLASHEVRCADTPITNETEWDAGESFPISATPVGAGNTEEHDVSGFRITDTYECTVRGTDIGGALTPIGNSVTVATDFMSLTLTAPMTGGFSITKAIHPVGDADDNGVVDFIAGGGNGSTSAEMSLYLMAPAPGTDTLPMPTKVVSITRDNSGFLGWDCAGLGDINDDDLPDFAISDPGVNGIDGAVYVLFGKPSTDDWADSVSLPAGADLVFSGAAGSAGLLGTSVIALGDVNGDTEADFAIGQRQLNTVYIIFGGASVASAVLPDDNPDGFVVSPQSGVMTDLFGSSMTGLGRALGGDTRGDLAIGAVGSVSAEGNVFVLATPAYTAMSGLQAIQSTFVQTGQAAAYPINLANAGDMNGDGFPELITSHGDADGRLDVFFGNGVDYSPSRRKFIHSDFASDMNDGFARHTASAMHPVFGPLGDLDDDGLTELLAGSIRVSGVDGGEAYGYFDAGNTTTVGRMAASFTLSPPVEMGSEERIPQFVGDLNGDGFPEIAVGDPSAGSVVVYY